jgi:hypothetical protein
MQRVVLPWPGVIASNGVNGSPRSEELPQGTGIQVGVGWGWVHADSSCFTVPKVHDDCKGTHRLCDYCVLTAIGLPCRLLKHRHACCAWKYTPAASQSVHFDSLNTLQQASQCHQHNTCIPCCRLTATHWVFCLLCMPG